MSAKDIIIGPFAMKDSRDLSTDCDLSTIDTKTNLVAALIVHEAGFRPIPIIPGEKIPVLKHHPWLDNLSTETIKAHWTKRPNHELGCITGESMVVLDVDTPESKAKLLEIEEAFDVMPNFVVDTAKGNHHYFTLALGTFVRSDSHSSLQHPDRIDVRTGSGLVIMPPSTGKEIALCEIAHARELAAVDQNFVDAIFQHNGRPVPRKQISVPSRIEKPEITNQQLKELDALVSHLDSNCGYDDWVTPGMAIHHETGGSEEGLSIWDDWSSQGDDYPGPDKVRAKWKSFQHRSGNPVTVKTLCKMAEDNGHDWLSILDRMGTQFEKCEYMVTDPEGNAQSESMARKRIAFDEFTLTGKSAQLESKALNEVYVLAGLALLGQFSIFYAMHNAGKTLLIIHLLTRSILEGIIQARDVYYFNLDDNFPGLIAKTKIAEKYGFNIICDGYSGFKVADFLGDIEELSDTDQARGKILILDTLKKFTDLMNKQATSSWTQIIRRFVMKGGTVIGLAHVNKHRGSDGKPVYAGTSDVIDDVDCAYVLDVITTDHDTNTKTVEFENRKRRGNVVNTVAYHYSIEDGISYEQLLASVKCVDTAQLSQTKHTVETQSDTPVIEVIKTCISEGIVLKMQLRNEVNERSGVSKRKVLVILDKYTGKDPDRHRWFFNTREHGKKVYQLLT